MTKLNCWEFKKCGRQPGGAKVAELGACPATAERRADKFNGGRCGGRACWAITGTLCGGTVQGSYAMKLGNCMQCEFFKLVQKEEGTDFKTAKDILAAMK